MNADWRNRYDLAVEAAGRAARLALDHFERGVAVEAKPDESPVTAADRAAEELLRGELLGRFPDDAFLGEESGEKPGGTGFRWVIDPIDGTRNFIRGIPIWGTLVGLEYKGEPVAGVCLCPALGTGWWALRGDGAYRGDTRLKVSDVGTLAESTVVYTSLSYFARSGRGGTLLETVCAAKVNRGYGDCWGFALVAQGSADALVDYGLHPWDIAGVAPIVLEAGGRVTSYDGIYDLNRPDVLATNGRVHDEILARLQAGTN
jgi:histidinol-phosphatase